MLMRKIAGRIRRATFGAPPPQLDPRLASLEQIFKAPPLTPSLQGAITLISPHFALGRRSERNRLIWQRDQNGACWAEYELLKSTLAALPRHARILEIGPGLGRSLVFFSKMFDWSGCELHAYEADGDTTRYTVDGPRFNDSWCGSIAELRNVLHFNGVDNVTIRDAKQIPMGDLPGPFDLVYGFYNIGFHWALAHFLPEIRALIGDCGLGIFTVQETFKPDGLHGFKITLIDKGSVIAGNHEKLLLLQATQ